jgi:hypothetical protein
MGICREKETKVNSQGFFFFFLREQLEGTATDKEERHIKLTNLIQA